MKDEIAVQLKPRLFGVLLVIIAILLLLIGFLLMVFLQPSPGQYYSRWVVALVALILLGGYVLLFPGIWKTFVGPGVGLFAGLSAMAVYGMATKPVSESSGYSGSDWD